MNFESLFDLAASLSLIVAMAYLYSQIRHMLNYPRASQVFLGIAFGMAAVSQMYRPFEPVDGLIIDLRAVPVAIAGAFLGWRAALISIAIAIGARLQIGGLGAPAGVMGIAIAGGCGILWQRWTETGQKRGILSFLVLATLMSSHLAAAVLLPSHSLSWFVANAMLPIFAMNMIAVPFVAMVLEHERIRHVDVAALKNAVNVDPESGLMNLDTFYRSCAIRACSMNDFSCTQIMVVRLRSHNWLDVWMTGTAKMHLLGAMFLRLQNHHLSFPFAGCVGTNVLLLPLELKHQVNLTTLNTQVRRVICEDPYLFAGGTETMIETDICSIEFSDQRAFAAAVQRISEKFVHDDVSFLSRLSRKRQSARFVKELSGITQETDVDNSRLLPNNKPGNLDILFEKADLMMRRGALPQSQQKLR